MWQQQLAVAYIGHFFSEKKTLSQLKIIFQMPACWQEIRKTTNYSVTGALRAKAWFYTEQADQNGLMDRQVSHNIRLCSDIFCNSFCFAEPLLC